MGGGRDYKTVMVIRKDENGNPILRDNGKPSMKRKYIRVTNYKRKLKAQATAQQNDRGRGAQRMVDQRNKEITGLLTNKDTNLISQLERAGFKRWTKHGKDRLYINASSLNASDDLYGKKTYIDLTDGSLHSEDGTLSDAARKMLTNSFSEYKKTLRQQRNNNNNNNSQYNRFMNMTDDEKATSIITSVGTKGDITRLPTPLQKGGESRVQKVVYDLGLNNKPTVLDTNEFNKFMKDNNIPKSQLLTRSADNPNTFDAFRTSDYNYIAGRKGGSVYGEGTYFAHSYGNNTGYGRLSMNAVLNPQTAKVVKYDDLQKIRQKFSPSLQKAVGSQEALIALAAGYNVIEVSNGYTIVLDRAAVVAENRLF